MRLKIEMLLWFLQHLPTTCSQNTHKKAFRNANLNRKKKISKLKLEKGRKLIEVKNIYCHRDVLNILLQTSHSTKINLIEMSLALN